MTEEVRMTFFRQDDRRGQDGWASLNKIFQRQLKKLSKALSMI